ncbi:zinc ribbon domain-containing protein [Chloracidobacterium validum]|uniref:Zinc ribbon domain-containing protein n=1 Tax=Chloracidobacterium validum TaxID=2821543 RepID=A0ABX8B5I7_9BACT|nr:zinc ribbon domain-containing protein [Chloracidobacterium validum]QUW02232.1 zinc ribbon domain-containing protein [Chloracidobacterium validum]
MPIYEYVCGDCGAQTEAIQKLSDTPLTTCSVCGNDALNRVVSAPSFTFKGSGWYITDYSAKGRQEKPSTSSQREESPAEAKAGKTGAGDTTVTSNAKPSTQAA